MEDARRPGGREREFVDILAVAVVAGEGGAEPAAGLEAAQGLLEALRKVRPMAMTSPTDFIW